MLTSRPSTIKVDNVGAPIFNRGRLIKAFWAFVVSFIVFGLVLAFLPRSNESAELIARIEAQQGISSQHKFSVLMPTFKRAAVMKDTVRQLAMCKSIAKIFVIWDDPSTKPLAFDLLPKSSASYEYLHYGPSNLNHRFIPPLNLTTDAVLSTDDDITVSCENMELAFKVWQAHPTTMVGFHPRLHSRGLAHPDDYSYLINTVYQSGVYSMVLTKLAFFHRKYLDAYTNTMYAEMKEYIATQFNCEDLSMSFMIATLSKQPPIFVNTFINEVEVQGISSHSGHMKRRGACLQRLSGLFGTQATMISSVKVAQIPPICSSMAHLSVALARLCASINFVKVQ